MPRCSDVFEMTWLVLSEEGTCDARGSVEYHRVRRDWNDAGRPGTADYNVLLVAEFIGFHANLGPPPILPPGEQPAGATE